MLIKSCSNCNFHEIRKKGKEKMSYCGRENCFSRYTKCIANKALNRFLEQESPELDRPLSATSQFYPLEQAEVSLLFRKALLLRLALSPFRNQAVQLFIKEPRDIFDLRYTLCPDTRVSVHTLCPIAAALIHPRASPWHFSKNKLCLTPYGRTPIHPRPRPWNSALRVIRKNSFCYVQLSKMEP